MTTIAKVSAAVVVATLGILVAVRNMPHATPEAPAGVQPSAETELLAAAEPPAEVAKSDPEPARRSAEVLEPTTVEASVPDAPTNLLRVELGGVSEAEARDTLVTVRGQQKGSSWPDNVSASWNCSGPTSEFALDTFFAQVAERGLRPHELVVDIDHARHAPVQERLLVQGAADQGNGRKLFRVRATLQLAAVVRGRLVGSDGAALQGLAGMLPMIAGAPANVQAPASSTAEDGSFTVRVRPSGPFVLAGYVEGKRPATVEVEAVVGRETDLGAVVIDEGFALEGVALQRGVPIAGARVVARARERAEEHSFLARRRWAKLSWTAGRFEVPWLSAETDARGHFVFTGLAPAEFSLRINSLAASNSSLAGLWDETIVHAPKDDVRLEFGWTSIRLEVSGNIDAKSEGRLVLKSEIDSADFRISGRAPHYVVHAPPETRFTGEVAFPGRRTVPIDITTPEAGGEVLVPVWIEPIEEAATLVLVLGGPERELPTEFSVTFHRRNEDEDRPAKHQVAPIDGALRLDDLLPGDYRVRVRAAAHDSWSAGLFHESEFDIEIRPGAETTRRVEMRVGAGLRITVRGADGELLGGEYELLDVAGARTALVMDVQTGTGWYGTSWQLLPHGTHETRDPLEPGRYRLVLRSDGYLERTVDLVLQSGVYEEIDVALIRAR